MSFLAGGQPEILRELYTRGGKAHYLELIVVLPYPTVRLTDWAYLEAEGYIEYKRGEYSLTKDGEIEARRAA